MAARSALDTVCARSAATCPPGTLDRLATLVAQLRSAPLPGVDVRTLVDLVADAGFDPIIDRELDPSVRAALAGDPVPLQRLASQAIGVDNAAFARPRTYDDLLYFAVACTDYPQLFDMSSPPADRPAQLAASLATADQAAFAPFSAAEWLQMNAYSEAFDACLDWPSPQHVEPPVPPDSPPLPASVPVLVVGGDLDSWTPLPDARALAPTLGANVRVVQIDNAVHTPAMDDTVRPVTVTCSAGIIRAFVQDPQALQTLDAGCGAAVPPIQVPAGYPLHLADTSAQAVAAGGGERRPHALVVRQPCRAARRILQRERRRRRDAPAARRPLRAGRHRQRARALGARERRGERRRRRAGRRRLAHAGAPGVRRSVSRHTPADSLDGALTQA